MPPSSPAALLLTSPLPFAVIVGVNHYAQFDKSVGQEIGTSDLYGSINDTRIYYRLARRLGAPPENVFVLTSAPVTPSEYASDARASNFIFDATSANILDRLKWLVDKLTASKSAVGFMAFSGHGDYDRSAGQIELCSEDTVAAVSNSGQVMLKNAITSDTLIKYTGGSKSGINLTFILDVCFTTDEFVDGYSSLDKYAEVQKLKYQKGSFTGFQGLRSDVMERIKQDSLALRDLVRSQQIQIAHVPEGKQTTLPEGMRRVLPDRARCLTRRAMVDGYKVSTDIDPTLTACTYGRPAYEFPFEGEWNGAFSRALSLVLDRWAYEVSRFSNRADHRITISSVLKRTTSMMSVLGFDQQASYLGPNDLRDNRIFYRETSLVKSDEEPRPSREHEFEVGELGYRWLEIMKQVSGETFVVDGYMLVVGAGGAQIFVQGSQVEPNLTYWFTSELSPFTDGKNFRLRPCSTPSSVANYPKLAKISHSAFSANRSVTNQTLPVSYDIRLDGATFIGRVYVNSKELTYYMLNGTAQQPPYFSFDAPSFITFFYNPRSISITGWSLGDKIV